MREFVFVPVDPTNSKREMVALNQIEHACAFSQWHQADVRVFHLQVPAPRLDHTRFEKEGVQAKSLKPLKRARSFSSLHTLAALIF